MTNVSVSDVRVSFGPVEVLHGVDLAVPEGSVVALLGPSGCGKTTLLRSIAGLEGITAGTITIGDRTVAGPSQHVPPEKRRIGMVFQDWALFPHLSVAANVGYGLPRKERKGARVDAALELVGLAGFGDRDPSTLSGGQQQRVALARALAPEPGVLLLDEPFSNLDTVLRARVRTEVHELLHRLSITTIFVTHDQDEAFVLGDRVAVMSDGRIVQHGEAQELYGRPADAWVARFVGDANFLTGPVDGAAAVTALGRLAIAETDQGTVEVLVRPEQLRLHVSGGVEDSHGTVRLVEYYGRDTVYVIELADGSRLRAREAGTPRCEIDDRVRLTVEGGPLPAYPVPG